MEGFSVGLGDIILVSTLAWKLYKAFKDADDDFRQVASDLMALHAVLHETQDYLRDHGAGLDASRRNRLEMLIDGCVPILRQLDDLHTRYDSLGTQAQRAWSRVRFGLKDLTDLRSRLVSSTTMLNAFNIALINSSTSRIEQRLIKFMSEVQAGLREGSVVTEENAAEVIEGEAMWSEFRRELEDVGISASVVEENRTYIAKWIKDALVEGALDEADPNTTPADRRPSVLSTDSTAVASSSSAAASSRKASTATLCVANEEFEQQLELKQKPKLGLIREGTSGTTMSKMSTASKRRAGVSKLLQRMMVKDKAIIDAASDGNYEKVAELVSLGVNVNVKDRWGWSALSMCAYGGHSEIARLLLEHDADLDNIDVDGDTPTSLAANRGHTDLIVIFDEERAARDLRLREGDDEAPRRPDMQISSH